MKKHYLFTICVTILLGTSSCSIEVYNAYKDAENSKSHIYSTQKNKRISNALTAAISLDIILGFVCFIVGKVGWNNLQYKTSTKNLKKTTGLITSSEMGTYQKGNARAGRYRRYVAPLIEYTYKTDDNETHTGIRIMPGELMSNSVERAKYYLKKYPVGKKVTVFYDYNDAVLEPNKTMDQNYVLAAFLIFAALFALDLIATIVMILFMR